MNTDILIMFLFSDQYKYLFFNHLFFSNIGSNSFFVYLILCYIVGLIFFSIFYNNKLISFNYLINLLIYSRLLKKKNEGFLNLYIFFLNHSLFFLFGLLVLFFEKFFINISVFYHRAVNYSFFFSDFFFLDLFIFILIIFLICFFIICFGSKEDRSFINNDVILIIWFSIFSLFCLIYLFNLIYIFICLEILSLTFYILLVVRNKSLLSIEASIKYLVSSALSSAFFLLGMCLLYFLFGTFNLYTIYSLSQFLIFFFEKALYFLAIFFIFLSIFFKKGLFPFYSWVADVYEGSLLIYLIFISLIPKIIYLLLLFKFIFFFNISFFIYYKFYLFLFIGIISLFIGTFGALTQFKIKRFLAYSSISQMSYILLLFLSSNIYISFYFSFLFLFVYIILMFIVFMILLIYFSFKDLNIYTFNFSFFISAHSLMILIWVLSFLSLAGLPPFSGFFTKFLILKSMLFYNYFILFVFILLFSSISIYYYLRFIIFSFFWPTIIKKMKKFFTNCIIESNFWTFLLLYLFEFNILFLFFFDMLYEIIFLIFFNNFFW